MNSNKSIEQLYKIIKSKYGKTEAKTTVRAVVSNILDDIEDEGLEVSEHNISKKLEQIVTDFEKATKSEVA